ncbi:response regulator transcription factor [Salisediminibacterium beveridgei]|uniref:DNA-binding response regulator n=1 Tax=Salisediminibacterium beveridgei TaxID=632773 RepID=A0A1D7QS88_9BACI|nr:response regulator transcription factor [Salisediminibacterium beveridgei]AOM81858.1 DNA-binding response regulator [Salisediminibacterium beveridgei]
MAKGKILVIDDEQKIRDLLRLYLLQNHYEPRTAKSGQEGLEVLKTFDADLVVLDIRMPGMDGFEVCRQIRETNSVPIIYLSAYQDSDAIISGLETGGDDYLTKPFDPNVLIARISALLRRSNSRRNGFAAQSGEDDKPVHSLVDPLSDQELRMLELIEKGYTNKEVAGILNLKESSVKVYNSIIFQKLQVRNRTEAIVRAKEANIL